MILFALILICCALFQLFFSWWIISLISFGLSAWLARTSKHAFRSAFWAISLLWAGMALYQTLPNDNRLANRVGQLFMLPEMKFNWLVVLLVSCILGGITAGFSALAGYHARQLFFTRKTISDKQ